MIVKLDADGRLALSKEALQELGLEGGASVVLEVRNGELAVKPADTFAEVYTDERIREFEEADELSPELRERLERLLKARRG